MGASCCGGGQGRRRRMRNKMVHSAAEPLLRESEREAVSSLLRYLEEGIKQYLSGTSAFGFCRIRPAIVWLCLRC